MLGLNRPPCYRKQSVSSPIDCTHPMNGHEYSNLFISNIPPVNRCRALLMSALLRRLLSLLRFAQAR